VYRKEITSMKSAPTTHRPKLVIIGGGFAGLYAAKSLRRAAIDVTLIDRRNFHLFQPLLYQVATGGLSPANISAPLRAILKKQRNVTVLMSEVTNIDPHRKIISLNDGSEVSFDYLIVATGVTHNYFGHKEWQQRAPGLKTIEDATEIRGRILSAFERAELETDPERRKDLLRFVVIGGGPTGVELAGALGEIAHQTLKDNYRNFDPASAKIFLVEAGQRILEAYAPQLSMKAKASLKKLGVTVLEATRVTEITEEGVSLQHSDQTRWLTTSCVLWGAGVTASPLGAILAAQTGVARDRVGRVCVQPDLTIAGFDSIYVVGDLASISHDGVTVPGVAPAAMQAGRYAALQIVARTSNPEHRSPPFRYRNRGSMATIGRSHAVAEVGRLKFSGLLAWCMWLFIHVLYLVEFTNRILVLIQWAWNYFTRNRAALLITGEQALTQDTLHST
jgi:NADH dehydrogenase